MKALLFGSSQTVISIESIEVSCYILEDYSRVISKNSLDKIFGVETKTENGLYNFFLSMSNNYDIPLSFLETIKTPILFIEKNDQATIKTAYESTFLLDICQQIVALKERKESPKILLKMIKTAKKINLYLEKKRINTLVDEVTGYNYFKEKAKENLRNYFMIINPDPAFEWVVTFTDSFYETVFKFMNISWIELKKEPNKIADFLYSIIFLRIDDKILNELKTSKPKRAYINKNGFLLNRENNKLQQYNQSLQDFLFESNFERSEFMQLIIKNFPKNTSRENLIFPETKPDNLSFFNEKLKIGLSITK